MPTNNYALILAGGSGTRFWPLSRNARPKQLLDLFGRKTLLEETIDRLGGMVPRENILILTNHEQEAAVRERAPGLPPENIIAEPAKRDTAPAIALAVGWVAARAPSATMIVLPADHHITDKAEFQKILTRAAEATAEGDALVTIGIAPTWPCPSYGYIERGARASLPNLPGDIPVFEVTRFREKPDRELAEKFLAAGNFSWNGGIFIWTLPTVTAQLASHCPELANFASEIRKSSDVLATIESQFAKLTPISIDYALMERADRVLNIEATFDWDDVGSWISLAKYLDNDEKSNRANCAVTQLDCHDNIVFSESGTNRRVALLGVHDLIIVQTEDAILVADRNQADEIKKLVKEIPPELL